MKIAVIGSGKIGGTLGAKWRESGYDVVYGSRGAEPGHPEEGPGGAPLQPIAETVGGAEVVVLAVPGAAVPQLIAQHGAGLAGKVVIDAVNRIGEPVVNSRAEIAEAAPSARYVRAFSTLGWENFADPIQGSALFYAADDDAVQVAAGLIAAIGLHPARLGGADAAGLVDQLLPVWFALVKQHNGNRRLALQVLADG